jgi:hypothetical protein
MKNIGGQPPCKPNETPSLVCTASLRLGDRHLEGGGVMEPNANQKWIFANLILSSLNQMQTKSTGFLNHEQTYSEVCCFIDNPCSNPVSMFHTIDEPNVNICQTKYKFYWNWFLAAGRAAEKCKQVVSQGPASSVGPPWHGLSGTEEASR